MAEAVILSAVMKIGVALGKEAIKEASLQFRTCITQLTELHGSMGRIGRELRLMDEYLCRMDIRNRKNQAYGIWVQEVRKLGNGIEDIVDEYLYLVGQKHDTGWSTFLKKGCKHPSVLFSLNRIASLVKEAEINLVHLFKAKDRWVSMACGGNTSDSSYIVESSQHLASISRSLGEEDLVGVDENREKLGKWLAGDDIEHASFSLFFSFSSLLSSSLFCFLRRTFRTSFWPAVAGLRNMERSVIALHGMGGLGKTALAANIYNKEREKFECHAWVSISQTYSIKHVLKCLITELNKEKDTPAGNIDNLDTNDLQDMVKNFLQDKKYLIVLDDVWDPEAVRDLFGALVQNQKGSRIIVTTRIDDVAQLSFLDRRITLQALSNEESSELFWKTVFPRDTNNQCPTELTDLAQKIVSKCKGVPLAIVTVGRLLFVRDKTKEEFKRICDQLDWELINNPSMEHVRNILYLSYMYLPTYLKSCFLYCSLFPEDYVFHRKKLVRLWVAEGFIEEKGERTLEEVAEDYLKDLVRRNMLQLVGKNSFGRMKEFKMHDILRGLAVDICKKDCFGVTYEEGKCLGFLEKDGRRLVVHKLTKDIKLSFSSMHYLRSVITLDSTMPAPFTLLPLIAEKCRYMSVLELSGLPIEKIPDATGDLFNLRHLGLRNTKVKLLPKSIEKLSNLLTLDLFNTSIQELPRGIIKLKKLRHLFAEKLNDSPAIDFRWGIGVHIPSGLGNLINLQTLQALEAQDESVRNLGELRQLRTLRIWNVKETNCGHLCQSLAQMRFLSNLYVGACDLKEVLRLNTLPPNLQKLRLTGRLADGMLGESTLPQAAEQNLCSLKLRWSQLREDPLPSLSRLANLTELFLIRAYSGEQMVFQTGWFSKLKKLFLVDLLEVKRLDIQEGAMASLERLVLHNLNSMVEVPLGIEFLMPLQFLSFREITLDFLKLLRQSPYRGGFWYTLRRTEVDRG